jgi:hypothetical protein
MFNPKRSLNYANVTATVALVLSMSGGALAATHYLINSTSQINPKVLKALKGTAGSSGAAGSVGSPGAAGPAGPKGEAGAPGAAGEKGLQGAPGAPGEKGLQGAQGAPGEKGATGAQGALGEKGATGAQGAPGEKGTALAYAHVETAEGAEPGGYIPTVVASESKGIVTADVEEPEGHEGGLFCISNVAGTLHSVVASLETESSATDIKASLVTANHKTACPKGTQIAVETFWEGYEEPAGFNIEVN